MSAVYLCKVDLVEALHINSISMENLASVKNLYMEAAVEMTTDLEICMIVKKDVSQSRRNVRDQNLLKTSLKAFSHQRRAKPFNTLSSKADSFEKSLF